MSPQQPVSQSWALLGPLQLEEELEAILWSECTSLTCLKGMGVGLSYFSQRETYLLGDSGTPAEPACLPAPSTHSLLCGVGGRLGMSECSLWEPPPTSVPPRSLGSAVLSIPNSHCEHW